ncbi:Uncharacterised protein [Vibrio cholerae]|nr:Uncharacterised protein [Vibrio cholerae]
MLLKIGLWEDLNCAVNNFRMSRHQEYFGKLEIFYLHVLSPYFSLKFGDFPVELASPGTHPQRLKIKLQNQCYGHFY